MELTKQSILNNSDHLPGIEGYLTVVKKIEENRKPHPDIAIEACKSLIEGLCKKALQLLSDDYNSKKSLRKDCDNKLPTLVKTAFSQVYRHSFQIAVHESLYNLIKDKSRVLNFLKRIEEKPLNDLENAVIKISAIRDSRGDISHGRIYPKNDESDVNLSNSICAITDGICSFMINEMDLQYKVKLKEEVVEKLVYKDMQEFNDWLDEMHHVSSIKVDFSKILYENAYDKYEEYYYTEFSDLIDEEEEQIKEEQPDSSLDETEDSPITAKEKTQPIKKDKVELVVDFDEKTFWNDNKNQALQEFAEAENLKTEELKNLVNDYLFTEKPPLRDEVAKTMNEKPKLSVFKTVVGELSDRIIVFATKLKKPDIEE